MKNSIIAKVLVFGALMLTSIGVQAQEMSASKVKQANVIALIDKEWNPNTGKGNYITVHLNDESRPAHKNNEILISENFTSHTIEINDYFVIDDEEIGQTSVNHKGFGFANKDGYLSFWIYDGQKNEVKDYSVEYVLFYKNGDDILHNKPLGYMTDLDLAYQFISQMFLAFRKGL